METPRARASLPVVLAIAAAVLAAMFPVAAAFSISYEHLRDLALDVGFTEPSAKLLPVGVDGALVAAAISLVVHGVTGRTPPATAWALGGVGIAASVAGNIVATQPTIPAREFTAALVAALPPIILALATEVVLRLVWSAATGEFRTQPAPATVSGSEVEPEPDSDRTADASPLGWDEVNVARDLTGHAEVAAEPAGQADNPTPDAAGQADVEVATGQDTGRADAGQDTGHDSDGEPDIEPVNVRPITSVPVRPAPPVRTQPSDTATKVAQLMARHPDWTQKQIAEELGVSERTVRRHQNALSSERRAS